MSDQLAGTVPDNRTGADALEAREAWDTEYALTHGLFGYEAYLGAVGDFELLNWHATMNVAAEAAVRRLLAQVLGAIGIGGNGEVTLT